jgi:hypothetical protein
MYQHEKPPKNGEIFVNSPTSPVLFCGFFHFGVPRVQAQPNNPERHWERFDIDVLHKIAQT